jgi:putrescine aminotransferase
MTPGGPSAVRGAIAAIREDDLVTRADRIGTQLYDELSQLLREIFGDRVATIRGVGLLIGIELSVDGLAGELLLELMSAGVIANHSLNSDRVLRLTPPAVLDERIAERVIKRVVVPVLSGLFGEITVLAGGEALTDLGRA